MTELQAGMNNVLAENEAALGDAQTEIRELKAALAAQQAAGAEAAAAVPLWVDRGLATSLASTEAVLVRDPHNMDCPSTRWPSSPRIVVKCASQASNGPNRLVFVCPSGRGYHGPGARRAAGLRAGGAADHRALRRRQAHRGRAPGPAFHPAHFSVCYATSR